MTRGRLSEVDVTRVEEHFQTKLYNMRNLPLALSGDSAGKSVCKFFVERTNIIREPVTDRIDFTHCTFQEFLAAKEVLHEDDIEFLVQHAHDDQWREVVLLASGLAQKKTREDLIDKLIGQGETDKVHRTQLYLLAATCLEASSEELKSNLKLTVQKRLSAFLPPKDMEEAEALGAVGGLAVPYLIWDPKQPSESRAACVYALGHIGGEEVLKALEGYIGDSDQQVIGALWGAWTTLQEKERTAYAQCVLSQIQGSEAYLSAHGHVSIDELRYCTQLTSLNFGDLNQVTDLRPLAALTQLTSLDLGGLEQIRDLTPLAALTQLTSLDLSDSNQVTDLRPLAALTQLRFVGVSADIYNRMIIPRNLKSIIKTYNLISYRLMLVVENLWNQESG